MSGVINFSFQSMLAKSLKEETKIVVIFVSAFSFVFFFSVKIKNLLIEALRPITDTTQIKQT